MRDYAQVKGDGVVTEAVARDALDREGVDARGLDRLDRRFLTAIVEQYGGGPVGLEAMAATINDEAETLSEMVEPYLAQDRLHRADTERPPGHPRSLPHLGKQPRRGAGATRPVRMTRPAEIGRTGPATAKRGSWTASQ